MLFKYIKPHYLLNILKFSSKQKKKKKKHLEIYLYSHYHFIYNLLSYFFLHVYNFVLVIRCCWSNILMLFLSKSMNNISFSHLYKLLFCLKLYVKWLLYR